VIGNKKKLEEEMRNLIKRAMQENLKDGLSLEKSAQSAYDYIINLIERKINEVISGIDKDELSVHIEEIKIGLKKSWDDMGMDFSGMSVFLDSQKENDLPYRSSGSFYANLKDTNDMEEYLIEYILDNYGIEVE